MRASSRYISLFVNGRDLPVFQSRELQQLCSQPINSNYQKTTPMCTFMQPFYLILPELGHPLRHAVVILSVFELLADEVR